MRVAANLMQKLAGIQDQSFDSFTHILERAMQSDMPKLLTCCEYHIAADPLHRFHPVASRLGLRHVLPLSSFYRIAEGLSIGFENMAARSLLSERRCGYCMQSKEGVCIYVPGSPGSGKKCARALHAKFLPGPHDFLQMAQR